jgi:hypothetical protein
MPNESRWIYPCLDGTKVHYKGTRFHNLKGPAILYNDGPRKWYIENTGARNEKQFLDKAWRRGAILNHMQKG